MKTGQLQPCLQTIKILTRGNSVIVGGGGIFADTVRIEQKKWKLDDKTAHEMALCAMDQFAHYVKMLDPEYQLACCLTEIHQIAKNNGIPICLASHFYANSNRFSKDWDTSSDSIAACLAVDIEAKGLILVKSTQIPENTATPDSLAAQGIIDKNLPLLLEPTKQFHCLGVNQLQKIPSIIS